MPAPRQGGTGPEGSRVGAKGLAWGRGALGSEPGVPPRWMPPCSGCWSGTEAPSPLTLWRCLRERNSLPPSRGALTWMLVCPCPWGGDPGSATRFSAEPTPAPRPPGLCGGQGLLCLLLSLEEHEGGLCDHCPGPAGSGCAGPGGSMGWGPWVPRLPGQRPEH